MTSSGNQNPPNSTEQISSDSSIAFRKVDLNATEYYRDADKRSDQSAELIRKYQDEEQILASGFSQIITSFLEDFLALGKLDGLTIASADGLVVAETSRFENADVMAAIGSVFEYVAERAQNTGIVSEADEMTIRGKKGELAVVRYFPNLNRRFFLMAYARQRCNYRRVTNLALSKCGFLLEQKFGNSRPEKENLPSTIYSKSIS
ncbi:MAG: hypothetical protein GXP30_13335 [Verrucomicrobia bacterium]|nr:hypothetical protein [Verrucomicrobiota bacterium]